MRTLCTVGFENGDGWRATIFTNNEVRMRGGARGRFIDGNVYDLQGNFLFGILA